MLAGVLLSMSTTEQLPELGGQFSESCPKCFRRECYVACRHLNETMLAFYNFENYLGAERHKALAESILNLQDTQLSQICEFELDICVKGALVGFPCVQCKEVCTTGTIAFDCAYDKITFDDCVTTAIDFQSTPALTLLYLSIINALKSVYSVDIKGVEEYANSVFSVSSEVVQFKSDTMYLNLNRALTSEEEQTWLFIKDTFPLPIGTDLCLVT